MGASVDTQELAGWYIEGCVDDDSVPRRYAIKSLPARIGRDRSAEISLPVEHVSTLHAEFYSDRGRLWLRDLASTNGTFRNGARVDAETLIEPGDILHFAHAEFVLRRYAVADSASTRTAVLAHPSSPESTSPAARLGALRELLAGRQVMPCLQPIVALDGMRRVGYEILGRGAHAALPHAPIPLLEIAERLGLAVELSRLFRTEGLNAGASVPDDPELFVNCHPAEMEDGLLVGSLVQTRRDLPDLRITVEAHERSVTNPSRMRELRAALDELDMRLAYDDFGAGQARLLELVEVPPDHLKFDISLIRDIDVAPAPRQRMLETLVGVANDMGIRCAAEGIEREEELAVCRAMGFACGQGFLLGRPGPPGKWS